MVILALIGCLYATRSELASRCQRYGISLSDCLNSTYLPRKEYDEYLQSFNMPIVRDASCSKGRCVAFVYRDPGRCVGCSGSECGSECGGGELRENPVLRREISNIESRLRREIGLENSMVHSRENEVQPLVHVIHHREHGEGDGSGVGSTAYKSLTVVETRTETISECSTVSKKEDGKERSETARTSEQPKEDVRTIFKTVEIRRTRDPFGGKTRQGGTGGGKQEKHEKQEQSMYGDEEEGDESVSTTVRYPRSGEETVPGASRDRAGGAEPEVVTVTRVVYKTVSVEKPVTLYREMTTTVKDEVPITNYKVTTVREVSTYTKTDSARTETVTQTQYSMSVSTQTVRDVSVTSKTDGGPGGVSSRERSKDRGETRTAGTGGEGDGAKEVEPKTLMVTVTKTQEKTVFHPSGNSKHVSPAGSYMVAPGKDGDHNDVEPGVLTSVICTENCSTTTWSRDGERSAEGRLSTLTKYITETKTVDRVSTVVQSAVSRSVQAETGKQVGRQEMVAELVPLLRDMLLETNRETETKTVKTRKKDGGMEPRTVTKVVTRTMKEGKKRKGGATVYNTVYSYKKKTGCRSKGVEGKERRQCHGENEEITTTVYV